MNLVIGGGLIGRNLYYSLRKYGETVLLGRKDIDLNERGWDLPVADVAYICAGETSTARCAEHPEDTARINIDGTQRLADELRCHVVWISSERVFDGSVPNRGVGDVLSPATEYGKQKAATEKALLDSGHTCVRFSKVLGAEVPLFDEWVRELKEWKYVYPFADMSMSPVGVGFACEVLRKVGDLRLKGLYQVSGDEDIPYSRVATHIANYLGYDAHSVIGIKAETPHPYTTLECNLEQYGIYAPGSWETIYDWCRNRCLT